MALIWECSVRERHYEVRTAGRTIRLYTNGVLHSQYHPDVVFGGGVWDLLGLPALWSRRKRLTGILLLGLGGGAVVRQLAELVEWERFVALDSNPVHLRVARRFFGLDRVPAEILEAEAGGWIQAHAGDKFELIIDDLFSDSRDEAERAVPFSAAWYGGLNGLLAEDGMLVVNFASARDLARRIRKIPALQRDFARVYMLTMPAYGNAVAVLLRQERTPEELDAALRAIKPRRRRARLRYHLERFDF